MRRSALLASVMHAGERRRLLASLPADIALQLRAQIAVVRRHRWDDPALVEPMLRASDVRRDQPDGQLGLEEIVQLSRTLGAATLSRVIMATSPGDASFILAALEPATAKAVSAELVSSRPLPPALAASVRNAAHVHSTIADPALRALP
ncbi:hypothetical protein HG421_20060 [Xanthomonas campestris pv. badrii]|uniref:Uncharacterized protein n=1 Tax=Xanthomonas campestris pv. badrii TaxID=149696 RepID=A0A7Z2ZK37_XANCA|nr:hypothetical protein HG421_20060 [Xanthomonas campestris pv. badrii]